MASDGHYFTYNIFLMWSPLMKQHLFNHILRSVFQSLYILHITSSQFSMDLCVQFPCTALYTCSLTFLRKLDNKNKKALALGAGRQGCYLVDGKKRLLPIRPNTNGRINKNRTAKNQKLDGRTEGPKMTIRLKNEIV